MSTRKAFFLGGLAVFLVFVLAFVLIGVFVPSSEDEIASVGEIPTTVPVANSNAQNDTQPDCYHSPYTNGHYGSMPHRRGVGVF